MAGSRRCMSALSILMNFVIRHSHLCAFTTVPNFLFYALKPPLLCICVIRALRCCYGQLQGDKQFCLKHFIQLLPFICGLKQRLFCAGLTRRAQCFPRRNLMCRENSREHVNNRGNSLTIMWKAGVSLMRRGCALVRDNAVSRSRT